MPRFGILANGIFFDDVYFNGLINDEHYASGFMWDCYDIFAEESVKSTGCKKGRHLRSRKKPVVPEEMGSRKRARSESPEDFHLLEDRKLKQRP